MKTLRVELKVCEACGALWFRSESRAVYCAPCTRVLAEFPAPGRRGRAGRKPGLKRMAVCAGGVR